jgi:hypothetical protein
MNSSVSRAGSELRARDYVLQQNTNRVLAELRCIDCSQFMRNPDNGFICKNNHYCCNSCVKDACSQCRCTEWTSPTQISRLAALVLHNELTSCIYKKTRHFEGCPLKDRYNTLVGVHEKRCSGRLVSCPGALHVSTGCNFTNMPILMITDHMNQCVNVGKVSSKFTYKITRVRD